MPRTEGQNSSRGRGSVQGAGSGRGAGSRQGGGARSEREVGSGGGAGSRQGGGARSGRGGGGSGGGAGSRQGGGARSEREVGSGGGAGLRQGGGARSGRGHSSGRGRGSSRGRGEKVTLYHYTDDQGAQAIRDSKKILMAREHDHFGAGTYLTSMHPKDGFTKSDIAANNYRAGADANLERGRVDKVVEVTIPKKLAYKCGDKKRDIWRVPNKDLDLDKCQFRVKSVE